MTHLLKKYKSVGRGKGICLSNSTTKYCVISERKMIYSENSQRVGIASSIQKNQKQI